MSDTPKNTNAAQQYLPLSSLYLDPNNFRFLDHEDYKAISDNQRTDPQVQRRTQQFLLGEKADHVEDLENSFLENGWLEVEPIHVRHLGADRYLVIEGNRRVATLKYLYERWQKSSIDLGKLKPETFDCIPIVFYDEHSDVDHLVVMGLHHISGKKRWPSLNQAKLIRRLRDEHHLDFRTIKNRLGISLREVNLSLRSLALAARYQQSEYGEQFSAEMFNIFREVMRTPPVRDWLGWEGESETISHPKNLERFFRWVSTEPEEPGEDEDDGIPRPQRDRVISTGSHVRDLSKIIDDPEALKQLDETRSLQTASLRSKLLIKNEIDGSLERCQHFIQRLFQLTPRMDAGDFTKVEALIPQVQGVLTAGKQPIVQASVTDKPWKAYNEIPHAHFNSLHIGQYRRMADVSLADLGRMNLIVGINNCGKTSTLEALSLLSHQTDPRGLLEMLRIRTRHGTPPNQSWLVDQFPESVRLGATFNGYATTLSINTTDEPDDPEEDRTVYLRSLLMSASHAQQNQRSRIDFFSSRQHRTRLSSGESWLCRSIFSSPFSLADPDLLVQANEDAIAAGVKEEIIAFLRESIDKNLKNIELVNEHKRFRVIHGGFNQSAPDLSTFGEGFQRIFLIALMMASARGGILLIDEIENAIHVGILTAFAALLHRMALTLNVQVFATTHSKEALEAFVSARVPAEDAVVYTLAEQNQQISVARYGGTHLARAIEAVDFDPRWS